MYVCVCVWVNSLWCNSMLVGGAQDWWWTWATSSAAALDPTCWNLPFPPVEWHLLEPGRFYLKWLGQKVLIEGGRCEGGGGWWWRQPLLCVPECVGACFGVGQRDFRRYDGWVRLCSHKKRKAALKEEVLQAPTYFPWNWNLEGNKAWR